MRSHLDLLITLLDAARREDRAGLLALLDPAARWFGLRPEWRCDGAEEVATMVLERSHALGAPDVELLAREDRAVLHLRLAEVEGVALSDGVYVACRIHDGRIARIDDHARRRDALPGEQFEPEATVPEAPMRRTERGLRPGAGWFVLNAADAEWVTGAFGAYTRFEGDQRFPRIGINLSVLEPGGPSSMYHREDEQEDFLVLRGECLLIVEEQERLLKPWDLVHCPPWTTHVFVGAGDGPCTLLALGTRTSDAIVYPRSEVALRHGAGTERTTPDPDEAYAGIPDDLPTRFDAAWLPG